MKIINQQIIEQFTERCPDEVVDRVLTISTGMLSKCIDELKLVTPALTGDYNFAVVGSHYFDSSTVNSDLNLFVIFNAPQLEINSYNLVNNKFKKFVIRLKRAWQNTKKTKKKFRKKRKKAETNETVYYNPKEKYTIETLKKCLVDKIIENIDKESYIMISKYGIRLVSQKSLGIAVNIYPVIKHEKNYNLYNSFDNSFFEVNFNDREKNLKEKFEQAGENFIYMLRVFNNLYYMLYSKNANQILIETILFNVPNELYDGYTFYESFIKIINYLYNVNCKDFISITDKKINIYKEPLITENPNLLINEMINYIDKNM